jgi:hypothetical protein
VAGPWDDQVGSSHLLLGAEERRSYQPLSATLSCSLRASRSLICCRGLVLGGDPPQERSLTLRSLDGGFPTYTVINGRFTVECGALLRQWVHAARRAALVSRIRAW